MDYEKYIYTKGDKYIVIINSRVSKELYKKRNAISAY